MPVQKSKHQKSAGTREDRQLLLEMGRALHAYGTPAHRLEESLEAVAKQRGIEARLFALPTGLFAHFGPVGDQRSGHVRLEPEAVDLGKIARMDEVLKALLAHKISARNALTELQNISRSPNNYGTLSLLLAFVVASAAGAVFFGGSWKEIGVSALMGGLMFIMLRLLSGAASKHVFVPLTATCIAAAAVSIELLIGPYWSEIAILSGVLYLLPGLGLTVALTELSMRNLVSGSARLIVALLTLLGLAFGVAVGKATATYLAIGLGTPPEVEPNNWLFGASIVLAPLAFGVIFQAQYRDLPSILVASILSFMVARMVSNAAGVELGAWAGAFTAGLAGNLFGRFRDEPPSILTVPAIILLVPGSVGFRSVVWMLAQDTLRAVDAAFEMAFVTMALTVGLLMANLLVRPQRQL